MTLLDDHALEDRGRVGVDPVVTGHRDPVPAEPGGLFGCGRDRARPIAVPVTDRPARQVDRPARLSKTALHALSAPAASTGHDCHPGWFALLHASDLRESGGHPRP